MENDSFDKDKISKTITKTATTTTDQSDRNISTKQFKCFDVDDDNGCDGDDDDENAKTQKNNKLSELQIGGRSYHLQRIYSMRGRTLSEGIDLNDRENNQTKKSALRSILKTNTFSNKNSKQCSFEHPSGDNHEEEETISRRHKSLSMLFNNKTSIESAPGDISSIGSVHFSPGNDDDVVKSNVLFYDPNQSAHDSVMTATIKPNKKQIINKTDNDCFVSNLEEENDSQNSLEEDDRLLKTIKSSSEQDKEHLLPHLVNCSILDYPTSQTYPFMNVCDLNNDNSTSYANSQTATDCSIQSTDDDPWYCEHCQTWFGSPDPSYPEYCRCLPVRKDTNKGTLTKSDTLTSNDTASVYSQTMRKDFRYYFQHPVLRIAIALSVVFCNFLIYSEDPISHSRSECSIPIVGNVLSFFLTKQPPELEWRLIKLLLNLTAIILGATIGKYFIHRRILKWARIKMFREDSGTWMIMGVGIIAAEYVISIFYNLLLLAFHSSPHKLLINSFIGADSALFMKFAACGTWLGDFSTAWMILDMMLQDNLYPKWAIKARKFWNEQKTLRIVIFWLGGLIIAGSVIATIQLELICWDEYYQIPFTTNELSRSFLASFILLQDLVIVMQDWDFPHFVSGLNIKLPGLLRPSYTFGLFAGCQNSKSKKNCEIKISGKWFNYGIIFMVMIFDLNMWKNQIIYSPKNFAQYVNPETKQIYSVPNPTNLSENTLNWNYRAFNMDQQTGRLYISDDLPLKAKFLNFPFWIKALSFIPIAIGFVSFFSLIYLYGRFPPKTDRSVGGRLIKRNKRSSSNWQRERKQSHRIKGSHYWSNIIIRDCARDFMARVSDRASQFGPILGFSSSNFQT